MALFRRGHAVTGALDESSHPPPTLVLSRPAEPRLSSLLSHTMPAAGHPEAKVHEGDDGVSVFSPRAGSLVANTHADEHLACLACKKKTHDLGHPYPCLELPRKRDSGRRNPCEFCRKNGCRCVWGMQGRGPLAPAEVDAEAEGQVQAEQDGHDDQHINPLPVVGLRCWQQPF
ncbi:hypothetical protein HMN09_01210800 [Mycena chlorophos]|uniref:Uncharacterized protein n=1 Tax=Mycena chlorophos TaxID=658473 RepID=A0A8H6S5L5_MYCCL|nr:hypothetical protein HMN09_01210800 [Mycena chlorophos]